MTTEQRHSYRCESVDEHQKAVIKIGGREIVVQLVNQSAGGFSVSSSKKLSVKEGKSIRVRTSAGWFQAQVVHKQVENGTTTLGLIRLGELSDPRDAQLVKSGGRKYETAGATATPGMFLMVMIVAALGFWCVMFKFTWFSGIDPSTGRHVELGKYVSEMVDGVKASVAPAATNQPPSTNSDVSAE